VSGDLAVVEAAGRSIELEWAPSTDDVGVTGYAVYRDEADAGVATTPAFTVEGLRCGQTYELAVAARDAAGNTSERAVVQAETAECSNPGLVAAYAFEDGVVDSSPGRNDGRLVTWGDTELIPVPGRYGQALPFGGLGKARQVDLPQLGTFYKSEFTLEAWVLGPVVPDTAIVGTWVAGQGGGAMLWMHNSNSRFHLTLGRSSANYLDSGFLASATAWQHVAATYDGATARFYVNGTEVASRPFTGNAGDSNAWRIGHYDKKGFIGTIDEVRIYDRALSAAEVRTDMETPIVGGDSAS
jgi:Concanavalin A-like lectin/glucanases superfamily